MIQRLLKRLLTAAFRALVANGPLAPLEYVLPDLLTRARAVLSVARARLRRRATAR